MTRPTADDLTTLLAWLRVTPLRDDPAALLRVMAWLKAERDKASRPVIEFRHLGRGVWRIAGRRIHAGRCGAGLTLAHLAARQDVCVPVELLFATPTAARNSVRRYAVKFAQKHVPELLPVLRSISISDEGQVAFRPAADCPALLLD